MYSEHSIKLKDTHYLVKWDKNDLPKIRKTQADIRKYQTIIGELYKNNPNDPLIPQLEAKKKQIGDEFYDIFEESLNDHKNLRVDPLNVSVDRKYILTWKGVAKMCRNITGQDTTTFAAGGVAVGEGTTTPTPFDYKLANEFYFIDFATNGFFDCAGTSIRYCGTFGEDLGDADLTESLVRNQAMATNSIVLCRNIFTNNPINHNSGNSGFSAAGIVEFIPVTD